MTKKEILQASADSIEAVSKELQEMAFRGMTIQFLNKANEDSVVYTMIGDAASTLDLVRAALLSLIERVEE